LTAFEWSNDIHILGVVRQSSQRKWVGFSEISRDTVGMQSHSTKFLIGLGLVCLGATILFLGAVEAWSKGIARLDEQATPAHLSLLGLGAAAAIAGAWLIVFVFRTRRP
jgi:hypothetical protein